MTENLLLEKQNGQFQIAHWVTYSMTGANPSPVATKVLLVLQLNKSIINPHAYRRVP
jgi:hypothetical protein